MYDLPEVKFQNVERRPAPRTQDELSAWTERIRRERKAPPGHVLRTNREG